MAQNINIIGAGLGGLASACLLASKGYQVALFEKNSTPGGKIHQIQARGFRFDTGPTLLTMPFVLEKFFQRCGASMDRYITLQPIDPICRYFYQDGTTFNCYRHSPEMLAEIANLAPGEAHHYLDFLQYAADLYDRTQDAFLFNPLYDLHDLKHVNPLDLMRIDSLKTMAGRIDHFFQSSYLRRFFKRFATYNGSSPFRAPATLNVIAHVELALGGYYVNGGMYKIVMALMKLAKELNVQFHFNTPIQKILLTNGRASALKAENGKEFKADIIISNSDAASTYLSLLPDQRVSTFKKKTLKSLEPSCSGFVLLLGINKRYNFLDHHNVFFSEDYRQEFYQIFEQKVMPDDPTIYIANTSASDSGDAPPGGSNLYILVNAPYVSDHWNWHEQKRRYENLIIRILEKRGLSGLKNAITYRHTITPADFYKHYNARKGSIYGTSSNSRWSAFVRAGNKSRQVEGLYLAGGSTHPGGGIPLVLLSAMHAAELVQRYEF